MGSSNSKINYLSELHMEKCEAFKAQDPEIGEFDVVFEIDGKKLYAHKSKLCEFSSTFVAMLSERWTTQNEPIPIKDYTFVDFVEFLGFLYSGECEFTNENIFVMVDISEYYNVKVFKKACQHFLLNMKCDIENVYQMLEIAYKYSLEDLKKSVKNFVSANYSRILKSEQIQSLSHFIVYDIVQSNQNTVRQEELFEMLFKRVENRAINKQRPDKNMNLNEAIKEELSLFLPFLKFEMMNHEFVLKFVGNKSFLFSANEFSDILKESRRVVTFIDKNGKMAKGILNCSDNEKMFHIIQSKKDKRGYFWRVEEPLPSSKLIKSDRIDWYLTHCTFNGNVFLIKRRHEITDFDISLLAEMIAEDGFKRDNSQIV